MRIKRVLMGVYVAFYAFTHKIQKRLLFISYGGLQYSDSPKVISERMHFLHPEYEIVWIFRNPEKKKVPPYVKKIKNYGFEFLKYMTTCCALVTNEDLHKGQYKREGQFFVQTWHADRPLKKVLYQIEGYKEPVMDETLTDLCVAASDYGERMYREGFRYKGEILKEGMPRNDGLINIDVKKCNRIKESLGIPMQQKILLFAPTFRDHKMHEAHLQEPLVDIHKVMDILNGRGKNSWVCFVRAHVGIRGIDIECDGKTYIDVTQYEDINDLYLVSDCLISDYSSCASDYILLKRPTILAIFDIQDYTRNARAIIDGFENVGFLIAHNQSELESIISNIDEINAVEEYDRVADFFGIHESGNSADRVCHLIEEGIKIRNEVRFKSDIQ